MVRHKCDTRTCVNPAHLELGTHVDNMRDMKERGRAASGPRNARSLRPIRGEQNGRAKLTANDVRKIIADDRRHRDIARDYGVCKTMIGNIKRREAWAILTPT